jgi:nicotinamidase-related amidase
MTKPTPIGQWTYDPATGLVDLSRQSNSDDTPKKKFPTLKTATNPIRFDPAKSALVIIDMQNFFLSPALHGASDAPSLGVQAANALLSSGIPAARKHGIRVLWVNWGLTDADLETMPSAIFKVFANIVANKDDAGGPVKIQKITKNPAVYKGLGGDLGPIDLGDGTTVEGGRVLMRDTWNAALYPPLDEEYRKGASSAAGTAPPDTLIHKDRLSALWGHGSDLEKFLENEGITTLFFAGVNTDQCVGGTLVDAFSQGYDCILLQDGAATTSPVFATEDWLWNCANIYGFVTSCDALMNSAVDE